MTTWTKFSDKQPKAGLPVWVKTRRRKDAVVAMKQLIRHTSVEAEWEILGVYRRDCSPDDLWCYAEAPPLPDAP